MQNLCKAGTAATTMKNPTLMEERVKWPRSAYRASEPVTQSRVPPRATQPEKPLRMKNRNR